MKEIDDNMKTGKGKEDQESQYSKSKGTATKEIENINVKRTKCLICNHSFTNESVLINHVISVHEGKKPYKCSICNYSFSQKGDMKKHVETVHEGKKPHKCSFCDYSCSQKGNLKKHVESVHERNKSTSALSAITITQESFL